MLVRETPALLRTSAEDELFRLMVDGVDTEQGLHIAMEMEGSQIEVKWRPLAIKRKILQLL